MSKQWLHSLFAVALGSASAWLAPAVLAEDYYWQNTAGGKWSVADNWRTSAGEAAVPRPSDVAHFPAGTYTITVSGFNKIGSFDWDPAAKVTLKGGKATVRAYSKTDAIRVGDGTGGDLTLDGVALVVYQAANDDKLSIKSGSTVEVRNNGSLGIAAGYPDIYNSSGCITYRDGTYYQIRYRWYGKPGSTLSVINAHLAISNNYSYSKFTNCKLYVRDGQVNWTEGQTYGMPTTIDLKLPTSGFTLETAPLVSGGSFNFAKNASVFQVDATGVAVGTYPLATVKKNLTLPEVGVGGIGLEVTGTGLAGTLAVSDDGWQLLTASLTPTGKGKPRYEELEILSVVCGSSQKALDPIEMTPVTQNLRIGPFVGVRRAGVTEADANEGQARDNMKTVDEKDL